MNKPKKILLGFFALLILAVILAAALLTLEISSPRIEAVLLEKAGEIMEAPVSSEGLSFRLLRGAKIKNIAVGEKGSEIFTAESIEVKANFLSLVRRRLVIESAVITRPVMVAGRDGFFPPPLPMEAEDEDSGFKLSIRKADVEGGRLAFRNEKTLTLADNVNIQASLKDGMAVEFSAEAELPGKIRMESSGQMLAAPVLSVESESILTIDWGRSGKALSAGGIAAAEEIGGKGLSSFRVLLSGTPDNLRAVVSGDMTGEEISYGGFFLKQEGAPAGLSASARLAPPRIQIEEALLSLGENTIKITGHLLIDSAAADLTGTGSLLLDQAAAFFPPAGQIQAGGSAELDFSLGKEAEEPFALSGSFAASDWRFSAAGGQILEFDFEARGGKARIKNITGTMAGGSISGWGIIEESGEYEFSIEGADIQLEDLPGLKKNEGAAPGTSGDARLSASIRGAWPDAGKLSGRGSFEAAKGELRPPPEAEKFIAAAGLAGLMPLEYDEMKAEFQMENGIVNADALLMGRYMEARTEKARFDLVKKEKRVDADILLSPALFQKGGIKLGELENLLYFDDRGYAHLGLVWDGPLAEAAPNMAASLLRTGAKRLRERLRR